MGEFRCKSDYEPTVIVMSTHLTAATMPIRTRKTWRATLTSSLCVLIIVLTPSSAQAQRVRSVSAAEDSLSATALAPRARAVATLSRHATAVSAAGLTRLIDLLRAELDGTAPAADVDEGDEEYGQYMMALTQLVARFKDPRSTALLARQGIAISGGASFQVATAGDRAIGPLVASWNNNEYLRASVILTMARMRLFADSTGAPLSPESRATIDDFILRSAIAPKGWLRNAFIDAVEITHDPVYLPLLLRIHESDTASIKGFRYLASDAAAIIPGLLQRRTAMTSGVLLSALRQQTHAACRLAWISDKGICNGLDSKLEAAQDALARGQSGAAGNVLKAFSQELSAQRAKAVDELAFTLLSANAEYLSSRM